MTPDLLDIFERALGGITSVSVQKEKNDIYILKSLQLGSHMPLTIINSEDNNNGLRLKLCMGVVFKTDNNTKGIIKGLIRTAYREQENTPCKLMGIIENDGELTAELVTFYTDYASVFYETERAKNYKESDFKLIVLSMLTELYNCAMGINDFISKTLRANFEDMKAGLENEKEQ